MLRYNCLCLFFLTSTVSYADELPSNLYQVILGEPVMSIKSAKKTSMVGMYSIATTKGQLDPPLSRLLVKIDKKTKLIIQILGEAELDKQECKIAASHLMAKYKNSFGINFSIFSHQGDEFNVVEQKNVIFMIGCENKRNTILRVTLARK